MEIAVAKIPGGIGVDGPDLKNGKCGFIGEGAAPDACPVCTAKKKPS